MIFITFVSSLFFFMIGFFGRNRDRAGRTHKDKVDERGLYAIAIILLILGILMLIER